MTHKLMIFDIDGTLTQTTQIDSQLFEKAVLDALPITSLNTNWSSYKYSTDTGILNEIIQEKFNRLPEFSEIDGVKDKFFSYLTAAFKNDPSHCLPINQAEFIFEQILKLGWHVAIATGGWETSALLKLRTANIPHQEVPIAHSDDHVERTQIISVAIKRSKKYYNETDYSQIVYLGDRHWDRRAAKDLGIGFIGIGPEFEEATEEDFVRIVDYADKNLEGYLKLTE